MPLTDQIKESTQSLRLLRRQRQSLSSDEYDRRKKELFETRQGLKNEKEARLKALLEQISDHVSLKGFNLGLEAGAVVRGKQVYTGSNSPAAYFALKQLQYSIRRLYKVRQSNRHHIVCQLREILADPFPKYVLRTDFSGFYESIQRTLLLKRLSDDSLLTLTSKNLIKRVLREYGNLSGASDGVPRGLGLSAYLSELYMRRFDEAIKHLREVVYFARYVDDVFIVYVPRPNDGVKPLIRQLGKATRESALNRNRQKTKLLYIDGRTVHNIDFLGYTFTFGAGEVELSIPASKVNRYKTRTTLAVNAYLRDLTHDPTAARQLLIKRLRFLTGNTRLVNNKRQAAVGIYFSNSLLTTERDLVSLDQHLNQQLVGITSPKLRRNLSTLSFTQGFQTKRYHRFSAIGLQQIVKVWKYAT